MTDSELINKYTRITHLTDYAQLQVHCKNQEGSLGWKTLTTYPLNDERIYDDRERLTNNADFFSYCSTCHQMYLRDSVSCCQRG